MDVGGDDGEGIGTRRKRAHVVGAGGMATVRSDRPGRTTAQYVVATASVSGAATAGLLLSYAQRTSSSKRYAEGM